MFNIYFFSSSFNICLDFIVLFSITALYLSSTPILSLGNLKNINTSLNVFSLTSSTLNRYYLINPVLEFYYYSSDSSSYESDSSDDKSYTFKLSPSPYYFFYFMYYLNFSSFFFLFALIEFSSFLALMVIKNNTYLKS